MVAIIDKIGKGLYTPSEAALYASVQTQLLNRWLRSKGGKPVIEPEFGENDKSVSFLDFVQTLAIREIRNDYKLPLEKIREAYDRARDEYKIKHPFAMRHKTFVFGEESARKHPGRISNRQKRRIEIIIDFGTKERPKLVQMTGKEHGNLMITQVAQVYMHDLRFDEQSGYATEYRPLTVGNRSVLMNPKVRFGEPIIETCGYSAFTLFDSYIAEGSIDAAARAYGTEVEEVELAVKYVHSLQRPAS